MEQVMNSFSTNSGNFNSQLWIAQYGKNERNNPRSGMVVALERNVLQKGMRRLEVRAILGKPEQIRHNIDVYDLGASPFGVDYEQYFIEYDKEDKVVKFFIQRS
jgi:hypothetical protein